MLLDLALPLSLAFIMFSLGYGLTFADFGRVLAMPKAVLTGAVLQICLVPAVAFACLQVFELPPALAFGVMILSFCPGGVTSNILAKLAGGTVALSITLTAIISLASVLTVPFFVRWTADEILGAAAPDIDVAKIGLTMFAITAVPVLIGLFARVVAPDFADRKEKLVSVIAVILFVVVVLGALMTNFDLLKENFATLGPLLMAVNLCLLVSGLLAARLIGLSAGDGICISIELGVQNATLGIAVASLIATSSGISEYAMPSALYGLVMYVVTVPGVFVIRRIFAKA